MADVHGYELDIDPEEIEDLEELDEDDQEQVAEWVSDYKVPFDVALSTIEDGQYYYGDDLGAENYGVSLRDAFYADGVLNDDEEEEETSAEQFQKYIDDGDWSVYKGKSELLFIANF